MIPKPFPLLTSTGQLTGVRSQQKKQELPSKNQKQRNTQVRVLSFLEDTVGVWVCVCVSVCVVPGNCEEGVRIKSGGHKEFEPDLLVINTLSKQNLFRY